MNIFYLSVQTFVFGAQMTHLLYAPIPHRPRIPLNHKESINVRIRLDSWRILFFSTHSVMYYDTVAKRVRNSYEYSRDSSGFGPSPRDTVPNSLRCAITYVEILQESITN